MVNNIKVEFFDSTRKDKKMMAIFYRDGKRFKTIHFGFRGASDYTIHKDPERQDKYIARHSKNREDWNNPYTAGALAMWVLWLTPNLENNIRAYKREFGFS